MRGMCTEKIITQSQSGTEKNAFLYYSNTTSCSIQTVGQNVYSIDALIYEWNMHKN